MPNVSEAPYAMTRVCPVSDRTSGPRKPLALSFHLTKPASGTPRQPRGVGWNKPSMTYEPKSGAR